MKHLSVAANIKASLEKMPVLMWTGNEKEILQ